MKIFKYRIPAGDSSSIEMPVGAKILSVGVQNVNEIYIWALVDEMAKKEVRVFYVFGTGHDVPISFSLNFIGTVQIDCHPFPAVLVWHVFEGVC